jgi:hypothetical protein
LYDFLVKVFQFSLVDTCYPLNGGTSRTNESTEDEEADDAREEEL